jgi:carbonic anhydrase
VVDPIVPVVQSLADETDDRLWDAAIDANIRRSVERLRSNEILAEVVRRDELTIVGRRYRLESGVVEPVA